MIIVILTIFVMANCGHCQVNFIILIKLLHNYIFCFRLFNFIDWSNIIAPLSIVQYYFISEVHAPL